MVTLNRPFPGQWPSEKDFKRCNRCGGVYRGFRCNVCWRNYIN